MEYKDMQPIGLVRLMLTDGVITQDQAAKYFPELADSKDEKIKKEIIALLKYKYELYPKAPRYRNAPQWISWLEAQGEQQLNGTFIDADDVREEFMQEVYRILDADATNDRANQIIDAFDNLPSVVYSNQGWQKPADKVEPKFKVGDWVVRELDNTCYQIKKCILNVTNNGYGYDLTSGGYISTQDANFYHLWTIQDAKDGDVLTTDMVIFIFKENKEGSVFMYCNYSVVSNSFSISNTAEVNEIYVHPSTKEQRDTLERAMTNAGYTFDFEKKELKKIEQNPVIEMKTSEESLGVDSDTYNEIVDECVYGEQKTTWSEEDENIKQWIISDIEKLLTLCKKSSSIADKEIKWLKDRVQPKQEWSDIDKDILFRTIDNLKFLRDTISKDPKYSVNVIDIEREVTWLKSLRPQNRLKLNEEQIKKELNKAANEWERKASFSPIAMVMDGDRPIGTKQHITSHADSFKAGVDWLIKKLREE